MTLAWYIADLVFFGVALQALLVIVLLVKRSWSKFPFFFAYSTFNFLAAVILYALRDFRAPYFYTYWIFEGIGLLLGFGTVYEIFRKLLFPYPVLKRVANCIFPVATTLFILLATVVIYAQSSSESNRLMAASLVTEEAIRIIELGMLMFLFRMFVSAFGLHWRQSLFGITLGLGLFTAVELAGVTLRTHLGVGAANAFGFARLIAIDMSLLVWVGYLLTPERAASNAEVPKRAQLEQWNQAVMELIGK